MGENCLQFVLLLVCCSPIAYHVVPSWMPNEKYHLILTQGSGDKKTGELAVLVSCDSYS